MTQERRKRGRPALAHGQDENRGGRSPVLCTRVPQLEADHLYQMVTAEGYEMSEFLRLVLSRIARDQAFRRSVLHLIELDAEQVRAGERLDPIRPAGRGGTWGR